MDFCRHLSDYISVLELDAPEPKDMGQFLTNHTVDIFVGAGRKKFRLHRDLLCDRLNYFTACSTVRFEEAQQKQLSLQTQ